MENFQSLRKIAKTNPRQVEAAYIVTGGQQIEVNEDHGRDRNVQVSQSRKRKAKSVDAI
jgi:hypothetical protein